MTTPWTITNEGYFTYESNSRFVTADLHSVMGIDADSTWGTGVGMVDLVVTFYFDGGSSTAFDIFGVEDAKVSALRTELLVAWKDVRRRGDQ